MNFRAGVGSFLVFEIVILSTDISVVVLPTEGTPFNAVPSLQFPKYNYKTVLIDPDA